MEELVNNNLTLYKRESPDDLMCRPVDERSTSNDRSVCHSPDVLHVIVPINNYMQYKRRYELFYEFLEHMKSLPGIQVYIVEVALTERPFIVTHPNNPKHLQLRTSSVMWHKENMINLMVQRLPRNWKYVAWIDGDIEFQNKRIAADTIHQLQHYSIVQLFQSVVNLGPDGQIVNTHDGFCYQYVKNGFEMIPNYMKYKVWHPGFAWACTRDAWNEMGGLIDYAILGSADHHMALALVGEVNKSMPLKVTAAYRRRLEEWEKRAERCIQRNIGYVKGTIIHGWHGKFADRKYQERWEILTSCKFDPDIDIKRDWQGLFCLDFPKHKLRDKLRQYFLQRNEDTIEHL